MGFRKKQPEKEQAVEPKQEEEKTEVIESGGNKSETPPPELPMEVQKAIDEFNKGFGMVNSGTDLMNILNIQFAQYATLLKIHKELEYNNALMTKLIEQTK